MTVKALTIKLQWSAEADFFDFLELDDEQRVQIRISIGGGLMGHLGDKFRTHDKTPGDGAWYLLSIQPNVRIT